MAYFIIHGFVGASDDKESACNAGDQGSTPGQEDPMEKERLMVYNPWGNKESDTTE